MQGKGMGPHLAARGKSHGLSRVALGTWGIILSFGRDDPSRIVFVQRCQDSCFVTRDNSGMYSRLVMAIRTIPEVRREMQCLFLFCTMILGFISIFKKRQASSPFEALNSMCLWIC